MLRKIWLCVLFFYVKLSSMEEPRIDDQPKITRDDASSLANNVHCIALNEMVTAYHLKHPEQFLPYLISTDGTQHVQKILLLLHEIYQAKRSINDTIDLSIFSKLLQNLLPAPRLFITACFIRNYGYKYATRIPCQKSAVPNSHQEKTRLIESQVEHGGPKYPNGDFLKKEGHRASPHFIRFDIKLQRYVAVVTKNKKEIVIALPSMKDSTSYPEQHVLLLSESKKQLIICFSWQPYINIGEECGPNRVRNHMYVFNIDLDSCSCSQIFQRSFKRSAEGFLGEFQLIHAELSPDGNILVLITSYGFALLKLKAPFCIYESPFIADGSNSHKYIMGHFSFDGLLLYITSYVLNKHAEAHIEIQIFETYKGELIQTLISPHSIVFYKNNIVKTTIWPLKPAVMLIENTHITLWNASLNLPKLFFLQSIFNKGIKNPSLPRFMKNLFQSASFLQKTALTPRQQIMAHIAHNKRNKIKTQTDAQKCLIYEEFCDTRTLNEGNRYCSLAIEGEGTQSLMAAALLAKIEEETGSSIADLFDTITGSSFGAVLGLSLAGSNNGISPLLTAKKYLEQLLEDAPYIFREKEKNRSAPYYSNQGLRRFLQTTLQESRLSETLTRFILPCIRSNKDCKLGRPIVKPFICDTFHAQRDASADLPLKLIASYAALHNPFFEPYTNNAQYIYATNSYRNNSAEFLYDKMISTDLASTPKQKIMVLSLGCGTISESIVLTDEKMKDCLGTLNYLKLEPSNTRISESITDIALRRELYEEEAAKLFNGREAYFRTLLLNKDSKHRLSLLED